MKYATTINDKTYIIEINDDRKVVVDGVEYAVDFESVAGQPVYSLLINGKSFEAYVAAAENQEEWQVLLHGELSTVLVEDEREKRLRQAAGGVAAAAGEFTLKAPMPGLIITVPVAEGQVVQKGDILIILESMKMQNELKCPRVGTITRVKVRPGEGVEQGQVLITIA
ncbi:MAG: biotin/lipoyl-binding protein [Anaerolineales bacterium]|nr:biotin/lipoyl-binding protein [Anaerolineales bacterium]